jgi:hypothetical protein
MPAGLRRVIATLLRPEPSLSLAGVRGADVELDQYQAERIRVSIGPGPERGSLIGLLLPVESSLPARSEARLLSEQGNATLAEVDELGNFEFEALSAGAYRLEIELPDQVIVVEHLRVD